MRNLIIGLLLVLIPFAAVADTGPLGFGQAEFTQDMQTDRPDFTEGTQTVQPGHIQFELGYTYANDDENNIENESHTYPELLARIGLTDVIELRLFWEGWVNTEVEDDNAGTSITDDGAADMSIGFKGRVVEETEDLPAFSILGEVGLPVGNEGFSSEEAVPAVKFLLGKDLNDTVGLSGNLNFASAHEDDDRFFEFGGSLAVGIALSEDWGAYVEYFGILPMESTDVATDTHFANGGFTYMLNENTQLDARAGFGLNTAADDFFTGLGISFRI